MIVKFFRRGKGSGAGPINYLLVAKGGKPREGAKVLYGDPRLTEQLINTTPFKQKYKAGVLSFTEDAKEFTDEQKKDITELTQTKEALELALSKSQSLQDTYKRVLEQGLNEDQTSKTSEIGITFEGSSETEKTKEYELYQNDLDLRSQLVRIERMLLDKQYIIEMISNKQDSGFAINSKIIFGRELSVELYYGFGLFLLAFMVLLGIEFLKFIEQYKKRV